MTPSTHRLYIIFLAAVCGVFLMSISGDAGGGTAGGTMLLKTTAFSPSGAIPEKYTCDGANISPDLSWEKAPSGTKSFALICDDPDAPVGVFTHWVLYGLAPDTTDLMEDLPKDGDLYAPEGKQGRNDFGKVGYGGPCPPRGPRHRYFFKLFALDADVKLNSGATKRELETAMKGHILAQAEVMGTYQRK